MRLNFKTTVELDALEAGVGWVHREVCDCHFGAQVIDLRGVTRCRGPGRGCQEEQHRDGKQRIAEEGANPFGDKHSSTLFTLGDERLEVSRCVTHSHPSRKLSNHYHSSF